MRIKLDTNTLRNIVSPYGAADAMISEWFTTTNSESEKKFVNAFEKKDAVKIMEAVQESTHTCKYSMSEICNACALYLGPELENRIEQTAYFNPDSVLSYLFFKEIYLEGDDTVWGIIQERLDSIYGACVDKLILTKEFIDLCEKRYGVKAEDVVDKYFHKTSTINEIIKEK